MWRIGGCSPTNDMSATTQDIRVLALDVDGVLTDGTLTFDPSTNQEIKSSGSLSGILTTDGKIEFPCGECGHVVQTPASLAGKKGRCPECQQIMQIPFPSNNPASQRTESRFSGPAPPPMEMSLINDFSEPLDELNQEPLDHWGDDLISSSHPVVSSLPTAGRSGGGRYRRQGPRKGRLRGPPPRGRRSGHSDGRWTSRSASA